MLCCYRHHSHLLSTHYYFNCLLAAQAYGALRKKCCSRKANTNAMKRGMHDMFTLMMWMRGSAGPSTFFNRPARLSADHKKRLAHFLQEEEKAGRLIRY